MGIEIGAKNLYKAYGVPALDLTFADKKSLVDRISGNNLITFTRSSVGTYVGADGLIKSAAVNEPRFDHNPTTGESLGLLMEEARTNKIIYSEEQLGSFFLERGSIVNNSTTSPSGAVNATKFVEDSALGDHRWRKTAATTAAQLVTLSVFVKANGRNFVWLAGDGTGGAWFNLQTATVTLGSGTITPVGNGWLRITTTVTHYTTNASNSYACWLQTSTTANVQNSQGDGVSGVFAWGFQIEPGAFPTSYIPTSGSTVTRAADVASITGSNFSSWYRQDEGTMFVNFNKTSTERQNPFAISDGSTTNRIGVYYLGTSVVSYIASPSGGFDQSVYTTSSPLSSKYAIGYTSGNTMPVINGALSTTITETAIPTNNTLFLGRTETGGTQYALNGTINRLTYYPVRFPDAQLQSLTAT